MRKPKARATKKAERGDGDKIDLFCENYDEWQKAIENTEEAEKEALK